MTNLPDKEYDGVLGDEALTTSALAVRTAQASIERRNNPPARAENFNPLDQDIPTVWSSLGGESREAALAVIAALNTERSLQDSVGEVIRVANLVGHVVRMTDQRTGEIVDQPRTVLLDGEGNGWAAVSNGVNGSLKLIVGLVGPPPWDPPLELRVTRVKTNSGFYVLKLVPVQLEAPARSRKK
jgi:Phage Single-stranded DNA-binding protein